MIAGLETLLAAAGLPPAQALRPLAGGANNRLWRVDTASGPAVVKAYFHHPDDPRDRHHHETAFAALAWQHGLRCLPRLLASDRDHRLALFAQVDGQPVRAADDQAVAQARDFAIALQALRPQAGALPTASEACFALAEHAATIDRRLARLLPTEAGAFVESAVMPPWRTIAGRLADADDGPLPASERCLSPSDFGFHNALRRPDGSLCFLDFEYAGWDDPAKLVGDFFNQVAVPVAPSHYAGFRDALVPPARRHRCDLLRPAYAVKWIAIVLNEFLPVDDSRRRFAGKDLAGRRARQLDKARAALARLADCSRG